MCLICVEIEKGKLTTYEARRNLGEMASSLGEHAEEVDEVIWRKEVDEMVDTYLVEDEYYDDTWDDTWDDYEVLHGNGD